MLKNYNIQMVPELAWGLLVAVVIYAGQALAASDPSLSPGETLVAIGGGALRVALAYVAGKLFGSAA